MHSVRAEPLGQRHAVVDDEGDVGVGAQALQRLGQPRQLMLGDVLDPQLEGARDPRLERGLEPVREPAADLLRADQVQLRRRRPRRRREVDGVELGFVQGQAGTRATDAS